MLLFGRRMEPDEHESTKVPNARLSSHCNKYSYTIIMIAVIKLLQGTQSDRS